MLSLLLPCAALAQSSANLSGGSITIGDDTTGTCATAADKGKLKYDPDATGTLLEPPSYGLVLHWPLDEDSGGVAVDTVGNNDGTLYNIYFSQNIGIVNGWARANAVNGSRIETGDVMDFPGTAPFTLALWVNIQSFTTAYPTLISKVQGRVQDSNRNGYGINIHDGSITPSYTVACTRWLNDNQVNVLAPDGTFPLRVWKHIACTYDGARLRLYVDGAYRAGSSPDTRSLIDTNVYFTVGNSPSNGSTPNLGRNDAYFDDVRVYNRMLTTNEIKTLYVCGMYGTCGMSGSLGLQYCDGAAWRRM